MNRYTQYLLITLYIIPSIQTLHGAKEQVVPQQIEVSFQGYISENGKKPMQDVLYIPDLNSSPEYHLFGLFDGHGPSGHIAAQMGSDECKRMDAEYKLKQLDDTQSLSLIETILLNTNVEIAMNDNLADSGTTGLVALVNYAVNKIFIGWVGDSRALIVNTQRKEAIATSDHNPQNRYEKKRLAAVGAQISRNKYILIGEKWRHATEDLIKLYPNNRTTHSTTERIAGLAMSRSLGDVNVKKQASIEAQKNQKNKNESIPVIIHTPEIKSFNLDNVSNECVLVMASDGIWDKLSNADVTDLCTQYASDEEADIAEMLGTMAIKKGSKDNISVIVVKISKNIETNK